jgi:hypothetical protein
MSKPKYVPNNEVSLWDWFNSNQDTNKTFNEIGDMYGISSEAARKLHLLWAAGDQKSFNQGFFSLFEGAPTAF